MGKFKFNFLEIEGLCVIEPTLFGDHRGFFMETYQQEEFAANGIDCSFVQDNHSKSSKGILRGLHFQKKFPQSKLVRVLRGEVFDVAVDLRPESKTFGKWQGVTLSEENHLQFFIPKGFAHGFLVLSDFAEFAYKCDDFYHPEDEGGLLWNDSDIAIDWAGLNDSSPILSDKDKVNPRFSEIISELRGN